MLIALTAVAAVLTSCNSGDANPPEGAAKREVRRLFVQTAEAARLTPTGGEGRYTLSLAGVDKDAVFFTDRPARDSGSIPERKMLNTIFRDETPPNAVIERRSGNQAEVMAVKLSNPRYDSRGGTLTYSAQRLSDLDQTGLTHYDSRLSRSLPPRLGPVALFIDDATSLGWQNCVLNLRTNVEGGLKVVKASKGPTNTIGDWVTEPRVGQTIPADGNDHEIGEIKSDYDRGCAFTVQAATAADSDAGTVDIEIQGYWGGGADGSCSPSPNLRCTQDPSSKTTGMHPVLNYLVEDRPVRGR